MPSANGTAAVKNPVRRPCKQSGAGAPEDILPKQLDFYSLCGLPPAARKTGKHESPDSELDRIIEQEMPDVDLARRVFLRILIEFNGSDFPVIRLLASDRLYSHYSITVRPDKLMSHIGGVQLPFEYFLVNRRYLQVA